MKEEKYNKKIKTISYRWYFILIGHILTTSAPKKNPPNTQSEEQTDARKM